MEHAMTIVAAPDVNTRFAAERADQFRAAARARVAFDKRIADGKLTKIGNGRYRVTDPGSWDNGEVLVRQNGQILPQHGLDTTSGTAALYSTTPAWHSLGSIVPEGTSDIDTVLALGRIDYTVSRRPVLFRPTPEGAATILTDQFVTVREDTDAGLGVVGARYEVLQNRQAFEFLQDLVDDYQVTWESAGALRDGRKVFVSMRLPETVTIDAAGISDEIVPFVVAINSHDGSSPFQVVVTPWRPICGNTERFAVRDAHTRWSVRHTRSALDRIEEARRTLGLSVTYYQRFAADEEALARTEIALADFHRVLDDLWPTPDDTATTRMKNTHTNRRETLNELWASNTGRLGRTAYAAERAITEYADWKSRIRPTGNLRGNNLAARATAAMEGGADETKTKAHRALLTLVRR
jgi:phage/plasmid-like protein (TIGR03299 family)